MRTIYAEILLCFGIASSAVLASPSYADGNSDRIKKILDTTDDLFRGTSSHGQMSMRVKTAHWTRTVEIEFWAQGEDKSFMQITAPKKEKGVKTLRVDKDMWNFLPKVKRVIKVPSSMMGGSWMGSHFSNNDLVKQSRMDEDFDAKITFEGKRGNQDVIEITGMVREDAVIVWGKVVLVCNAKSLIPIQIDYYDEDMKLARKMTFSEPKMFGKRNIPATMKIIPTDAPDEYTEMRYKSIDFDAKIPDKIFTKRNLKR
ncbi:MAG: outer membrane lipoprotein-sorting protein [Myxococcota bacterium]|nr:outer membrane lipoprotein-sorting protein [Myxococcota bacterium]